MLEEVVDCQKVMEDHFNKPLKMKREDELAFQKARKCYICRKKYQPFDYDNIAFRDHCHITGEFRGSAHKYCNIKLKLDPDKIKIPVKFHNLKGYDSHFIMQKLGQEKKMIKYRYLLKSFHVMQNTAFYIGNHLAFIDSFQFMSQSLDKLPSNLPEDQFLYTNDSFQGSQFTLMKKKGVYPYDYVDSHHKFQESQLPNKDNNNNDNNNFIN